MGKHIIVGRDHTGLGYWTTQNTWSSRITRAKFYADRLFAEADLPRAEKEEPSLEVAIEPLLESHLETMISDLRETCHGRTESAEDTLGKAGHVFVTSGPAKAFAAFERRVKAPTIQPSMSAFERRLARERLSPSAQFEDDDD